MENMNNEELMDARRQATREGFDKESFGTWMNLACRYSRLGKPQEAADCAKRALNVWDRFPHLKDADYPMPADIEAQLRAKAQSYISEI
jgi:hypothetical protein